MVANVIVGKCADEVVRMIVAFLHTKIYGSSSLSKTQPQSLHVRYILQLYLSKLAVGPQHRALHIQSTCCGFL